MLPNHKQKKTDIRPMTWSSMTRATNRRFFGPKNNKYLKTQILPSSRFLKCTELNWYPPWWYPDIFELETCAKIIDECWIQSKIFGFLDLDFAAVCDNLLKNHLQALRKKTIFTPKLKKICWNYWNLKTSTFQWSEPFLFNIVSVE